MGERSGGRMAAVRYPVTTRCVDSMCTEGGRCSGHEDLIDVDDAERDHPETFAFHVALGRLLDRFGLTFANDTIEIDRATLAQAYADPDGSWALAARALRQLPEGDAPLIRTIEGEIYGRREEGLRDAVYSLSRQEHDHPEKMTAAHRIALSRLLACASVNDVDLEGCDDPASLALGRASA